MPFPNRSITITIVQWLKHAKYSYKEGKGSIKKMGRVQKLYFFGGIFCGGSHTHTPPTLMFSEWTKQPPFLLLCRFRHSKSCLFCPKITVIVRKVWICCKRFRGRFDHFSDSALRLHWYTIGAFFKIPLKHPKPRPLETNMENIQNES